MESKLRIMYVLFWFFPFTIAECVFFSRSVCIFFAKSVTVLHRESWTMSHRGVRQTTYRFFEMSSVILSIFSINFLSFSVIIRASFVSAYKKCAAIPEVAISSIIFVRICTSIAMSRCSLTHNNPVWSDWYPLILGILI